MVRCTVCDFIIEKDDFEELALHFINKADNSDSKHISWLNRYITKNKSDKNELKELLEDFFSIKDSSLEKWVKKRFVEKFYSHPAHPFVEKLQRPSRATLLGYVIEHQHFLRQWVRSCAYIIAQTDYVDVTLYELDNINTEFGGFPNSQAHYELLLQMGESLGLKKEQILEMDALSDTKTALRAWHHIAKNYHWLETMLAMHGLELIAHRGLRDVGASKHYFDPIILTSNEITEETKTFLREGYEADVFHFEEALELVEKYATELHLLTRVQSTFLKSIDIFDKYLMSRLKRAEQFED